MKPHMVARAVTLTSMKSSSGWDLTNAAAGNAKIPRIRMLPSLNQCSQRIKRLSTGYVAMALSLAACNHVFLDWQEEGALGKYVQRGWPRARTKPRVPTRQGFRRTHATKCWEASP